MGDCKSNMDNFGKDKDKPKKESILGRIRSRKAKDEKEPEHFSDMIERAEETLESLIKVKEADLKSEKGKESQNQKKLAVLQTMQFHLDNICDLGEFYSEI